MKKMLVSCLLLATMFTSLFTGYVVEASELNLEIPLLEAICIKSDYGTGVNSELNFAVASKMGDGTQTLESATIVNQSEFSDNETNIQRLFITFDLATLSGNVENVFLKFNAKFNGNAAGNVNVYAFEESIFDGGQSPIEMYANNDALMAVQHESIGLAHKANVKINSAQWFSVDITEYFKTIDEQDKIVLMLEYVPVSYNAAYSAVICMDESYEPYIDVQLEDIYNPSKIVRFSNEIPFFVSNNELGLLESSSEYSLGSNNPNGDAQLILDASLGGIQFDRIIKAELKLTSNFMGNDGGTLRFFDASDVSYTSPEEFIASYPTIDLINKEALLGSIEDSDVSGDVIERSLDVTDFILGMESNDNAKILIDYVPFTEHTVYVCITKGILATDGYPYIELTLDTPPKVENISIDGDYIENETLTLDYDFIADSEEENSEIKWYAAEKSGDTYINPSLICENSLTLTLDERTIGKYIYVEIKPVKKMGFYLDGEVTRSDVYEKHVTSIANISTLLQELSEKETTGEYFELLAANNHIFKVDVDLGEKKESVRNLVNTVSPENFEKYRLAYNRAIVVTDINNETSIDNINGLIENEKLGLKIDGYNKLKDTLPVDTEYYQKNISTLVDFDNNFHKLVAYRMMKEATRQNVLEYLTYNDFILSSDIESLSPDVLETVGVKILKYPFTDFQTLDTGLGTIITNVLSGGGSGGGGSGGTSPGNSSNKDNSGPSFSIATDSKKDEESKEKDDKTPIDIVKPVTSVEEVDTTIAFTDLSEVSWAENAITDLTDWKIVSGNGDGTFGPLNEVTREQFVKMIVLAFDFKTTGPVSFEDIEEGSWYSEYVSIAYNNRIINGVSANRFGVGENITRQDMAVIIYNAAVSCGMEFETANDSEFEDFGEVADYAKTAVTTLANAGIINGVGDGRFAPYDTANRAMAAVIIHRLLECSGNHYSKNIFNVVEMELTEDILDNEVSDNVESEITDDTSELDGEQESDIFTDDESEEEIDAIFGETEQEDD